MVSFENTHIKTDGLVDYNDTSTNSVPLQVTANTWTDIPNNGLGANTLETFLPPGVTSLLDTSTGYLIFSDLKLGDEVFIRPDFKFIPFINNAKLECRCLLGLIPQYSLKIFEKRLDLNAGIPYDSEKGTFYIYMGQPNVINAPAKLQIRCSSPGELLNAGLAISIKQLKK